MIRDVYTRIGEEFGTQLAIMAGASKTRSITISSIDEEKNAAMCYMFEAEDDLLPVPLTLLEIEQGMLKVTPTVGSLAVIAFINGDENRPYFVTFSQVDKIEFLRSATSVKWTIDPEDDTKDEVTLTLGKVIINAKNEEISLKVGDGVNVIANKEEINVKAGDSTVLLNNDVIEMNGGGLKGLVVVGKLTERLNKLQSEIDKIQQAITSHSHGYIDSKGAAATPTPSVTTSTTYSTVPLTQVKDDDYINEKITQ